MAFLLDTVTLSELRKKNHADPNVQEWQSVNIGTGYLSCISLNEIRFGIRIVENRDKEFATRLWQWYGEILRADPLLVILPVDRAIAELAADFRHLHKMSYNDALIAPTAQAHDLTLATRNVADFKNCGITIINPWGNNS